MNVQVVNRKIIKPCTPTPSNLRTYRISVFDELNEPMHVIRILYYSSSAHGVKHESSLEESLAKVLPLFYPLAGRYMKEKRMVDCNDEGAEYTEAEVVDVDLLQFINNGGRREIISANQLKNLLPLAIGATDEPTDAMLAVQVNKFRCGGLAIGVCASHRILDSASLGIFLQAWATAAVNGDLSNICPDFSSSSLFPAENLPPFDLSTSRAGDDEAIVFRRFVFDRKSISVLRDKFHPTPNRESGSPPPPPSRVVVVSAFLTQALLRADRIKYGKSRALLIMQAINIRERTVPPIPKHAIGTWVSASSIEYTANESQSVEHDFAGVVTKMRESTMQGVKNCARILSDEKFGRWVMVDINLDAAKKAYSGDYKVLWFTDWSKFGEYELDFGFGKPVWVSLADVPVQDLCILMNNKENDGIEAWVYLRETDMSHLQQDEDLKSLSS